MNPEIQDQVRRISQFNETESKKMIEIKKLLTSKLFLVMLISIMTSALLLIITNTVNGILTYITPETENVVLEVIYILFENIISTILVPGFFVVFGFILRKKASLLNTHSMQDSVLRKLLFLRSIVKLYFIVMIISFVSTGITYNNIDLLQQYYPTIYDELMINGSIDLYRIFGLNSLILGGLFTCMWYSLSRGTKMIANNILLDREEKRYVEIIIFIVFLIAVPLMNLIGVIIGLTGTINPLTSVYFTLPIIPSDYLVLIYSIVDLVSIVIVGLVFLKLRSIMINTSGSTNPLVDNDNVYTINLTEEDLK